MFSETDYKVMSDLRPRAQILMLIEDINIQSSSDVFPFQNKLL